MQMLKLHTKNRQGDHVPFLVQASTIKRVEPTAGGPAYIQLIDEQEKQRVIETF